MRFKEYAVGKITKQNTTADVKPGEIKRQAAKFGNKIGKDGKPPTLGKKIRGSKTNVLFNLGMAESKEIASTTEIFIDMDGVLADFFTEWGKLMGKKDWRDIGPENISVALDKIKQTENFWLDLPLTSNAKNLINLVKQVKGEYNILSSPLPGDPNSEPHKRQWIKKNLNFFPPKKIFIRHDKESFATQSDGTPNILIDDYGVNVRKWEASGGVGFKHKDHKFERTAKAIKQHMDEPVEENKSYTRDQLPQIREKNLKNLKHTLEYVHVDKIIPVQKERIMDNFKKQVDKIVAGDYNPIVVDCDNKIVNGHHRWEAAKLLGFEEMAVAKLPYKISTIVERWSLRYRRKINCDNPKGFSQRAHCAGRKKK